MTQLTIKKSLAQKVEEMQMFAAQLEQGLTTWDNACGYDINEELLSFLNLPSEGEYV